jgi:hypothetical protein
VSLGIAFVVLLVIVIVAVVVVWYLFRGFRIENQDDHELHAEILEQQTQVIERLDVTNERLADATDRLTEELELIRMGARRRA